MAKGTDRYAEGPRPIELSDKGVYPGSRQLRETVLIIIFIVIIAIGLLGLVGFEIIRSLINVANSFR